MAGMDTELPSYSYEPYDNLVDYELANIMTRTSVSQPILQMLPVAVSHSQLYQGHQHPEANPLLELQDVSSRSFDATHHSQLHVLPPDTVIQLSEFEPGPTWAALPSHVYPQMVQNGAVCLSEGTGPPLMPYITDPTAVPDQSYQYFDDRDSHSPWSSSPEYAHCRPLTTMEDDDTVIDEKPYARLIYEALMQAPGHKMMLREIYEWFRHNTTKPIESGSNGWQNSIRHNLSMNKAFENDRDIVKGSSRKATSVWVLTEDAVKNGVQSTTRYRKTGAGKRPVGGRLPAIQRQRAGAKGGRAARNSAKRRHQDHTAFSDLASTASPSTTSYSDYGDYQSHQSYDCHEMQPAMRSWPMTPMEDHLAPEGARFFHPLSPRSTLDLASQHLVYKEDNLHLQRALL